ncbi:MAG: hypothetical protein O7D34_05240 [Ignavibacteria bacterium]|nr:hypothetical protein [Ignavibacteria bacterium]
MRHTLGHDMSPEEAVEEMVEGNEVALFVLTEIINKHTSPGMVMLDLDDMNIRGEQIKIGLELCHNNVKTFTSMIGARSQWLADEINKECLRHRAVVSGASDRRAER